MGYLRDVVLVLYVAGCTVVVLQDGPLALRLFHWIIIPFLVTGLVRGTLSNWAILGWSLLLQIAQLADQGRLGLYTIGLGLLFYAWYKEHLSGRQIAGITLLVLVLRAGYIKARRRPTTTKKTFVETKEEEQEAISPQMIISFLVQEEENTTLSYRD